MRVTRVNVTCRTFLKENCQSMTQFTQIYEIRLKFMFLF